jgi:CheY-like chemotaxis protein
VGIAPEVLPKVFDMFVQGTQSIDRSHGGLGLGLTIARSLIEAHGGTIRASSDGLGHGAAMTIRLPLADDRSPVGIEAVPELAAGPTGMRVVVVDDNEDAALLVAHSLERDGFAVRVANTGAVAIDLCRDHLPVAAILDIGLPVIDGYELARRIRAIPELAKICLIAMTGYGQAADRERAKQAGFDHHLVKPVTIAALRAILDSL